MKRVPISPEPKTYTTTYDSFRGVDFSKDPLLVDKSRSPYAVNLVSDKGGQPEKRVGWRVLQTIEQPINALGHGYVGDAEVFIAHGGTKLYTWTTAGAVAIRDGIANTKSSIFFAQHQNKSKMFILTGAEFLMYDGTTVKNVEEEATIPTVIIAGPPAGGGKPLNPINLLQPKRIEKRRGDGTAKVFQLSANKLDAATVTVKKIVGTTETELVENTDFTVNRDTGQITFTVAPPATDGSTDNVIITYAKTVKDYASRIKKCRSFTYYGLGGSNRIFVTRNPEFHAQDWWCEINDPTYFPDINYAVIGNNNTAIMGYAKIGEYLAIVKEDNQQDTTIFMREAYLLDGNASFPVKPGVTGIGAISPYSFANLIDEPLFLSRTGIFAITSNIITAERTLQNRSYYVDSQLTKEPSLQNAVATEWNGYYVVAVNGNAYLLDSKQRGEGKNPSSFYYECYFWNNIPATCFLVHNGELYFGTPSGQICKFNTDIEKMHRFNDNGVAITAIWSTKADNDGIPNMTKTMQKKGCLITLKPFVRSGVKIFVKTEKDTVQRLIKSAIAGILTWEDLDFDEFTFISNDNARTIPFKKKVKKYQSLQFFVQNDKLNQGFGVFNIVKNYNAVGYIKR